MVIGLIITGVFAILFVYLGYRDWRHSKLSSPESAYIKYSSPELYIISILGIPTGVFISFGLIITLAVILLFLPACYLFLKIFSPYFDFLPPQC
jgi:hypothetical protein